MIQFSIPTALSIFAATSAVAVTSVAVAVPALQQSELEEKVVATSTITPTPTSTSTSPAVVVGDSPLSSWGNHDIGNGVSLHDLSMGFNVIRNSSGVIFSYVGPCQGSAPTITVWGNNGQVKSSGGAPSCQTGIGGITFASSNLTWGDDTRNSYCYAPMGGASAYRAELYGMFTEWVPIPEEYKQCQNGQAPWGPLPPGEVAPVAPIEPVAPVEPAPAPSPSDSNSPSPSTSATP